MAFFLTATCLLWAASFAAHERYVWAAGSASYGLVNCDGRLQLRVIDRRASPGSTGYAQLEGAWGGDGRSGWENDWTVLRSAGPPFLRAYAGGCPFRGSWAGPAPAPRFSYTYECCSVSHWFVALLLTAGGAWLAPAVRRRARGGRRGFPAAAW